VAVGRNAAETDHKYMTKDKIKNLLDYIPLITLTVSSFILIETVAATHTSFLWRHIAGLIILPIVYFMFWWRHKTGVVVLGLSILLGLFSVISYSYSVVTMGYFIAFGTAELNVSCQPIFLLWIILHFIFSSRHYRGIFIKQYWHDLFIRNPEKSLS
jgi:hypothetical protein